MSSALTLPWDASLCLTISEDSKLGAYSARLSEYHEKTTDIPCSKNFLTFHIVMRLVGEEEMTMMGLVERAFLARFKSEKVGH